jgi:hypothetical protein
MSIDQIPEGKIVVHNHVVPSALSGNRGFRHWLADKTEKGNVECPCWWAPQLPVHYRRAAIPYEDDPATKLIGRLMDIIGVECQVLETGADHPDGEWIAEIEEAVLATFYPEDEQ